jgi:hypothetical protein
MYQPVIIIGAPRSGTNMLRDMLVQLEGAETWPCDEINYIWRHHNVQYPSDEYVPEMATPRVQAYVRKQFDDFARQSGAQYLIEKTCANSLRVGFVDRVIPEAKYIFIVRNGYDTIGSALLRWKASLDLPYIMKKARYVPMTDLPYYALRYGMNHIRRQFSREKRLSYWGPTLDNMKLLLEKNSLYEVIARQWKSCVENAERDFSRIAENRIHRVKYEDFVQSPVNECTKIADYLGLVVTDEIKQMLGNRISADNVGKGKDALGTEVVEQLKPILDASLKRYGYK